MELQKCSLANPCREVLEQSHVYLLGLIDIGGFGSVGYLAFDFCLFWIQLITRPRFKKGSVHKHRFALVSERAAWLVRMVRIHSWKTVRIQTLLGSVTITSEMGKHWFEPRVMTQSTSSIPTPVALNFHPQLISPYYHPQ